MWGRIGDVCKGLLSNMKRGVSERKESTAEQREGWEEKCFGGVAENRRHKDSGEETGSSV